jgi:hypothetical protein
MNDHSVVVEVHVLVAANESKNSRMRLRVGDSINFSVEAELHGDKVAQITTETRREIMKALKP